MELLADKCKLHRLGKQRIGLSVVEQKLGRTIDVTRNYCVRGRSRRWRANFRAKEFPGRRGARGKVTGSEANAALIPVFDSFGAISPVV